MKHLFCALFLCIQLLSFSSCEKDNNPLISYSALTSVFDGFCQAHSIRITDISRNSENPSLTILHIEAQGTTIQQDDERSFRKLCVAYGEKEPHIFYSPIPYTDYTPLTNVQGLDFEMIGADNTKHALSPFTEISFSSHRKYIESGYRTGAGTMFRCKLSAFKADDARWINKNFYLTVPTAQLQEAKHLILHLHSDRGTLTYDCDYPIKS